MVILKEILINLIRKRAGMPNLALGLSQSQMRSAIQQERRVELAFENHRFWDVRRWKIANVTDNGPVHMVTFTTNGTDTTFSYPVLQNRTFIASKEYLLPIPQAEIDRNAGKNPGFKQNPGW